LASVTSRHAASAGPSALALRLQGSLVTTSSGLSLCCDGAALTRRATPLRLRFGVAAWGELFVTACAAQEALVLPRLARSAPGRRLRVHHQVGEDLLDDRPLEDGRDALQFPGAAVRAVRHVDVKDALERPRPADAVRPALNSLGLAFAGNCGLGGPCGTSAASRCMNSSGLNLAGHALAGLGPFVRRTTVRRDCRASGLSTRCVVPSRHRVLSLSCT
jgi:hypothetical protein